MNVVAFTGPSGVGKTTLMTGVIAALKAAGRRVSVVKHAHRAFDIDHPGKDSFRHREAGAFEVVIASSQRLAKIREFEAPVSPTVHQLLAELVDCDWALVEGYFDADIAKIELWRSGFDDAPGYPDDPFVVALAAQGPLPVPTLRDVLPLDEPAAVAAWLLAHPDRCRYDRADSAAG